jgi:hypothetical protein
MATASAMAEVSVVRIDKQAIIALLHERSISCSTRSRSGWPGCSCCEPALARKGKIEPVIPRISQEVLAEMVGNVLQDG